MTAPASDSFLWSPRRSPWRWLLAAAAALAAIAHLPVLGPHLDEAPYLGEEFIVLTAACALLAVAAVGCDTAAVYGLAIVTCGLAILGYVATRLIAFPQLADDVGNWSEPLGVVSIAAESLAFVAAVIGLGTDPRPGLVLPASTRDHLRPDAGGLPVRFIDVKSG